MSAFYRLLYRGANELNADLVLIDVGPNLGAINRAALISADYVVVPLGADLFSLQGLQNLGPALIYWRKEWSKRLKELPNSLQKEPMPKGCNLPDMFCSSMGQEKIDQLRPMIIGRCAYLSPIENLY